MLFFLFGQFGRVGFFGCVVDEDYRVGGAVADGVKIVALHPHQVDEARIALHFGTGEQGFKRIQETFFFSQGVDIQSPCRSNGEIQRMPYLTASRLLRVAYVLVQYI